MKACKLLTVPDASRINGTATRSEHFLLVISFLNGLSRTCIRFERRDMPQLHQCLSGTGASSRFWLPHWTLKHTLILLGAWLQPFFLQEKVCTWWVEPAERLSGLILFFAENPRALLSSLFPSRYLCQMYQIQMGILGRTLSVSVFLFFYHIRLISCHYILVPSVLIPSHTKKGNGLYWGWISKPFILICGAGTPTKYKQPEVQAISSQCFVYFLPLFHIHSALNTAVLSSPSCDNERANFKKNSS